MMFTSKVHVILLVISRLPPCPLPHAVNPLGSPDCVTLTSGLDQRLLIGSGEPSTVGSVYRMPNQQCLQKFPVACRRKCMWLDRLGKSEDFKLVAMLSVQCTLRLRACFCSGWECTSAH